MRRSWRLLAAVALLLAAGSFLFSAYLYTRIQAERSHNIVSNCRDVNDRHDATIRKLDELVASRPVDERDRARRNRAGTVALLNAIVPKRDCAALVDRQVHRTP